MDYEVYLDESFSPIAFANSLVQATNDAHDADVDLTTPTKRLKYDLDEVEQRIKNLTASNYEDLIEQASTAGSVATMLPPLRASLDHVNSSYAKLQRDILNPYYSAQKLYTALRRLHSTSGLLRAMTWYLYLARQLATLMKPLSGPSGVPENPRSMRAANLDAIEPKDLLQAAQTLLEIRAQLKADPGLRSLQVIRTHEASLGRAETNLILHCQNVIRFYRAKMVDPTPDNSIARASSPSLLASSGTPSVAAGIDYAALITHACYTLFLLKPETLASSIRKFLVDQVNASVGEIVRSLTSLNMSMSRFTTAMATSCDRALNLFTMNTSLQLFNKPASLQADSLVADQLDISLWEFLSSSLDIKSLPAKYWHDLGRSLEQQVRDFTQSNPNITKTIRFKDYPNSDEIVDTFIIRPFTKDSGKSAAAAPSKSEAQYLAKAIVLLFR